MQNADCKGQNGEIGMPPAVDGLGFAAAGGLVRRTVVPAPGLAQSGQQLPASNPFADAGHVERRPAA
ncbi:MAG: hypothetical protein JXA57_14545, partial [Armatimonadetes bacterium]|nr:hypothetical protein [Armatimonadota bacterium]